MSISASYSFRQILLQFLSFYKKRLSAILRRLLRLHRTNISVIDITGKVDKYVTLDEFMEKTSFIEIDSNNH